MQLREINIVSVVILHIVTDATLHFDGWKIILLSINQAYSLFISD